MSTIEKRFRRNFVAACIVHVAVIGGIVVFEGVLNNAHSNVPTAVELITPADILGDLPKGEGMGRGAYTPPPPGPAGDGATAATGTTEPAPKVAESAPKVSEPTPKTEEPVAPKVKTAAVEAKDPNEIAIPKKSTVKEVKKTADTSTKKTTTSDKTADKSTTTTAKKTAASGSSSAKSGSTGPAVSADSIRQHFASALSASEGGSPYGDNKPAGGGTGVSKYGHLGSPDGTPDGIAGGVGKGSPFWSYYMHVHDRMYEAWDQPGQSVSFDKKLVATVVLHVARDGRIEGVRMEHSSGNKLMDDSAMAAAHNVPRLDPLPDGLGGAFAEISVNFRLEG